MNFKCKFFMALLLLVSTSAFATELMTKNEFTEVFYRVISSQMPETKFSILSDLRLHSKDIDGYELNIFLDNAYDVYVSGQRSIDLIYSDQIKSIKNHRLAISNKDIKSILPVLKPKDYIDTAITQLKETGYSEDKLPFYYEKLNEDIFIMYVFDSTESMSFVSPEAIKKYGISANIQNIAMRNLENFYESINANFRQIDTKGTGSVYVFVADENYEASLLLAGKYLNKLTVKLDGDLILFVPARNIALMVGSNDTKGYQLAAKLAARSFSELGYSISPYGYINVNGIWKRFSP